MKCFMVLHKHETFLYYQKESAFLNMLFLAFQHLRFPRMKVNNRTFAAIFNCGVGLGTGGDFLAICYGSRGRCGRQEK